MKKHLISTLLIVLLLISGCSSNTPASISNEKPEAIVSENTETQNVKKVGLNDDFELITKYGNLNIKVNQVRRTDWAERDGKPNLEVILIEAECENVSFDDPVNTILYLDPWIFAYDSSDFQLSSPFHTYDDGLYEDSPKLPIGSKARVFWAYYVSPGEKNIKINFNNCAILEAEISD